MAFEIRVVIKKIDPQQRTLNFAAGNEQRDVRLPEDARCLTRLGKNWPTDWAAELRDGVHVTLSIYREGDKSSLQSIRLGRMAWQPAAASDSSAAPANVSVKPEPPVQAALPEQLPDGSTGQETEFRGLGGIVIPAYIRKPAGNGRLSVIAMLHGGKFSKEATLGLGRSTKPPVVD